MYDEQKKAEASYLQFIGHGIQHTAERKGGLGF